MSGTSKEIPEPRFVAVDKDGKETDVSILDETGVAYDPAKMTVDLTKAEKRRTTALMLAINAYANFIIKDAEMYRAISADAGRGSIPAIKPATMDAIIDAALRFDAFIAGKFELAEEEDLATAPETEKQT